jgi:Domain of unknown function (DUF4365)
MEKAMAGAIPGNLHEGGRSEILADYLFSRWGAVTPVRRQDDYGIDLYCTLTDRVGQLERVCEYFTVQVKSTEEAWKFDDREAVQWLIEYPTPLFLCIVSKRSMTVRIYHVFPRFYVWAFSNELPDSLELTPGEGRTGQCVQWVNGSHFSLSAPIIEAGMSDLTDNDRLQALRAVFAHWVRYERENCDLVRQGLPRFRMPASYTVNEMVNLQPVVQQGNALPPPMLLERGMLRLAEALECVGGLQGHRGDHAFALEAALLLDRLQTKYPDVFKNNLLWRHRIPGQLGQIVLWRLLKAIGQEGGYLYAGLEAVENMMENDPIIQKYLTSGS